MSASENSKGKAPLTMKIKFKSANLEQFIERYSVDVSKGGIFIRTKEPQAVGTSLRFEFQLQDGTPLIVGEGTVVWNRSPDPSKPSVAPGMGVRFDKLTTDSQERLDQILAEKARRGETGVESRFDAGVRSSLSDAASPSQVTPTANPSGGGGGHNEFGDEPTRAMAADQVNKLAEAMGMSGLMEEDAPTKANPAAVAEALRKKAENQPSMAPMTPAAAKAGLSKTLLGQGFGMMTPPTKPAVGPVLPPQPPKPIAPPPPEPVRAVPDSAKTPTASVEEQQQRIADSSRTPTGASSAATPQKPLDLPSAATPTNPLPASASKESEEAPKPAATPSVPPPKLDAPESLFSESAPVSMLPTQQKPGGKSGLIAVVGALALLLGGGGAYYALVLSKKPVDTGPTLISTTPGPATNPAGSGNPTQPTAQPTEVKPVEPVAKPPEPTSVPVKPDKPIDGTEVTTEPPGAQVEYEGKQFGPTPARIPGLVAGKSLHITLPGYLEVKPKIKAVPKDGEPLSFTLTAIERVVELTSQPKGADVYFDGKKVGKTPFQIKKLDTKEKHEIELRKAGFASWTRTVSSADTFEVKKGKEVLTVEATLSPSADAGAKKARPGKKEAAEAAPAAAPAADKAAEPAKAEEKPKAEEKKAEEKPKAEEKKAEEKAEEKPAT
jgi:uncharacterized protein (TIGR02266 family)